MGKFSLFLPIKNGSSVTPGYSQVLYFEIPFLLTKSDVSNCLSDIRLPRRSWWRVIQNLFLPYFDEIFL